MNKGHWGRGGGTVHFSLWERHYDIRTVPTNADYKGCLPLIFVKGIVDLPLALSKEQKVMYFPSQPSHSGVFSAQNNTAITMIACCASVQALAAPRATCITHLHGRRAQDYLEFITAQHIGHAVLGFQQSYNALSAHKLFQFTGITECCDLFLFQKPQENSNSGSISTQIKESLLELFSVMLFLAVDFAEFG